MMNENTKAYIESLDLCLKAGQNNNGMALKCSSLCSIEALKTANQAQVRLRSLYSRGFGNLEESLSAKEVLLFIYKLSLICDIRL